MRQGPGRGRTLSRGRVIPRHLKDQGQSHSPPPSLLPFTEEVFPQRAQRAPTPDPGQRSNSTKRVHREPWGQAFRLRKGWTRTHHDGPRLGLAPEVTAPSATLQPSVPPSVTALLPVAPWPLRPANVALPGFVIRSVLPPLAARAPRVSRILDPHPPLCSHHSPPFWT